MLPHTRKDLTAKLSKLSTEIAAELRLPMLADGAVQARARVLHTEERVGQDYKVWTDLLSRRAAVLWVLKSLYVRVLEDRGLLKPSRILDRESQALFGHLAPNLGETAYLRWVYTDLASPNGGLPELFAPQPAEIVLPSDALSRKLIDLWRARDPETNELTFRFDDEQFDGRLMGDLYQDLDPVVKKRYALLQTPEFILDFILDETLTPAIAEWGVETVRVLDPACGSGHFLLAAFKRIVAGMREKFPGRPVRDVVQDALKRVVGIDLNDYACALARARLVMTALELTGETALEVGGEFHPQVYWADALEQVERDEQLGLGGVEIGKAGGLLTRPEVRAALRPVLKAGFHAVVGNPPYVTEKDAKTRDYHKEKIGRGRRYVSAAGMYSLGAPFTERMLQLAVDGGFVGEITSDSFMKREFGKAVIEQVLARKDLTKVVCTAGAYIPGHGTPTVMLFARNRARTSDFVRVIMGKRGEPGKPLDAATGKVWSSIAESKAVPGYESEFISVANVPNATMAQHPWSIGGGGGAELKSTLEAGAQARLHELAAVGGGGRTSADETFLRSKRDWDRLRVQDSFIKPFVVGEGLRDWSQRTDLGVFFPYADELVLRDPIGRTCGAIWPMRSTLWSRTAFGSSDYREAGRKWFEWHRAMDEPYKTPLSLLLGEVATHNHIVLDRGGKLFHQTAPVIKLPAGATEAQHLVLLAQLNSSTACFWLKQVCQDKGIRGEGGGFTPDAWEHFYQFGGTKLESFPVASTEHPQLNSFAHALDTLARARADHSARVAVDAGAKTNPGTARILLAARRTQDTTRLYQMVALQEELDWLCYRLYGLDPDAEIRPPEAVPPLVPGLRPFEITLAIEDTERREALARGEEPDEAPTAWFTRHGWDPVTTLDSLDPDSRRIAEARLERTAASRDLALIEQPTYKRRWYKPDYDAEEKEALESWLADRLEAWAKDRKETFTLRDATSALQSDPAVVAVGELLAGRPDFDLEDLLADRLRADAVPNNKHHVYKPDGLIKRAAWEETWRLQHLEDAGDKVAKPQVPEKYGSVDFLKSEYWSLRGKLDVPKERFIAFTEVPGHQGAELRYGWAGWTHRERAKVLLGIDEELEAASAPIADRHGVLYGVWFLLPYVAWESVDAAADFRADVKSQVGEGGVTEEMLGAWAVRWGAPKAGGKAGKRGKKA